MLEEILIYAPKDEDAFVNGVLGENQGKDNIGRNINGVEICAHSGLGREEK